MSTESVADLGVSRAVIGSLSTAGIIKPFATKRAVIGDAIAGRDVIAKSPTGSGNTLAFGIPLVERIAATDLRPAALVSTRAPRRRSSMTSAESRTPVPCVTAVDGGVGLVKQAKDAAASHVLVATAGRLEDLLARGAFRLHRIRMLVLERGGPDARHGLSPGDRPDCRRLPAGPADAVLPRDARRRSRAHRQALRACPAIHQHGAATRRADPEIEHRLVEVTREHRVEAQVRELCCDRDLTLVFVGTKHGADRLVKRLAAHGVKAAAMHGDKSQRQREEALTRFASGAVDTVVATDVAARGLDVDRISRVINFDPPADSETYMHSIGRIGRTGRAGQTGIGITLHSPEQRHDVTKLAGHLGLNQDLHGNIARRSTATASSHATAANGRSRRRRPSGRFTPTRG